MSENYQPNFPEKSEFSGEEKKPDFQGEFVDAGKNKSPNENYYGQENNRGDLKRNVSENREHPEGNFQHPEENREHPEGNFQHADTANEEAFGMNRKAEEQNHQTEDLNRHPADPRGPIHERPVEASENPYGPYEPKAGSGLHYQHQANLQNGPRYGNNSYYGEHQSYSNPGAYYHSQRYNGNNTYEAETQKNQQVDQNEEIRRMVREEVQKSKPKHRWLRILALLLVGTFIGTGATFGLFKIGLLQRHNQEQAHNNSAITATQENPADNSRGDSQNENGKQPNEVKITLDQDSTVENAVATKAIPSIVGITALVPGQQNPFYFYNEIPQYIDAVGSGVIVDSNGYILTNSHVIDGGKAEKVTVSFSNNETSEAKIIWQDPTLDLAMIKVDKTGLPAAELGDSDQVQVGDKAIAVGNPLGLDLQSTLTSGYISGLNRTINVQGGNIMDGLIQTDAAINSGNSGGALLNAKGQVIGINTARPQTADGIGFAIPINVPRPIIAKIVENGDFESVYIGITGFNAQLLAQVTNEKIPVEKGVVVKEIMNNSAADKAGIKQGDIIVSIDGNEVDSMNSLKTQLLKYDYGDTAKIKIYRDNAEQEVEINFVEFDSNSVLN